MEGEKFISRLAFSTALMVDLKLGQYPTPGALASNRSTGVFFALCLPIIGLVATRVGFGSNRRTAKGKLVPVMLACIMLAGLVFQMACGGSSNSSNGGGNKGTPPGTYTINVTGTYSTGSLVHTAPTTLTVQ